MSESSAFKSR